jgi:two-component system probable response regulator PhcQ
MQPIILVVDDEPSIRELLKEALLREPYDVLCTGSAEEALAVLKQNPVDVIISDEKMPGMSGSEMLAIARQKYPNTIRIILTGHARLETAIRSINEGEIYRFFTKPCNMVDLAVTIRQALQQRELLSENQRLLNIIRQQSLTLEKLEKRSPGITKVKRDANGAVIIDEE